MRHVLGSHHATVVAYLALFVALGGSGYAATRSFGPTHAVPAATKKKKHATVLVHCATTVRCLGKAGPRGATGATGAPGAAGTPGAPGSQGLPGAQGATGAAGLDGSARAYGVVSGTTVSHSKNVTSVTNPAPGLFCIALAAGIDPSTTGIVATPDEQLDGTSNGGNFAHVEGYEGPPDNVGCPAGTQPVATYLVSVTGGNMTANLANEGFFFAVP